MPSKFALVSDLHLEFDNTFQTSNWEDADVYLLAGDICQITYFDKIAPFLHDLSLKTGQILWIFGNHEYYGSPIEELKEKVEELLKAEGLSKVKVMDNEYVIHNDVRIIGSTLWTSFWDGDIVRSDKAKAEASICMADFRRIEHHGIKLSPEATVRMFRENVHFIEQSLLTDEPCIVLTHHMPSFDLVHKKYKGLTLNLAFASDLNRLMGKPKVWCFGHTHNPVDQVIGSARCIANPHGYPEEIYSSTDKYQPIYFEV